LELVVELRHLRYFVAVGEEEHFGRAADRLHVVQPALTRQVRQLEDELGLELFERLKRGVRLTEAGKSFLLESKQLLSDLERAVDRTRLVAQGKLGRLRVGFAETATYSGELPAILRDFRARSPDVRLELFPSTSVKAGEQLRDQQVDVAFVYIVPGNIPELNICPISVERWILAVPRTHRLARAKRVRLGDLKGEPFVWFPRPVAPLLYDRVLSVCHAAGLTMNIVQEANSPTTLLSLVAGGIGLNFAIESAEKIRPDNVTIREVEDLRLEAEFYAIWKQEQSTPALITFIEIIRSHSTRLGRGRQLRRVSSAVRSGLPLAPLSRAKQT
jgi:DNA-binding transcriptional LysR family regulator